MDCQAAPLAAPPAPVGVTPVAAGPEQQLDRILADAPSRPAGRATAASAAFDAVFPDLQPAALQHFGWLDL
ncbi:hypothetical protein [Kitasatospora sp. NPDC087314]|uniref:hypothetical protein n=1 Tax=Kitasatospora sp. NPDC087314 TaxID=3364068 RepID=UPI003805C916